MSSARCSRFFPSPSCALLLPRAQRADAQYAAFRPEPNACMRICVMLVTASTVKTSRGPTHDDVCGDCPAERRPNGWGETWWTPGDHASTYASIADDGGLARTRGLLSTFAVAVPGGEGGPIMLSLRHRSVTVEPSASELFRLMGAAVWPAAMATIKLVTEGPEGGGGEVFKALQAAVACGGRLLELGSGHGLGGLAVACLPGWRRAVLTDKDRRLVQLIEENCARNRALLPPALVISGEHCVWAHAASEERLWALSDGEGYDAILTAGCTYSASIVDALFTTIRRMLAAGGLAVVVHQSRECQHLFSGVSVRQTLREKPQGYFRGSKRTEHMQPCDIIAAASRHHLRCTRSLVMAEENQGQDGWQPGICILQFQHVAVPAAQTARSGSLD